MILGLVLSFAIATAIGLVLLRLVWPRAAAVPPWPLAVALGVGIGAGLSAVLLFVWILAFGPTQEFLLAEAGLLVAIALVARRRAGKVAQPTPPEGRPSSALLSLLAVAFLVTLGAATAAFLANLWQHPHGEWDAWMNWNLRARMFFRGGEGWRSAFSAAIPWSHPDYPVLLPSLVTRSWLYAARETLVGPTLVAATFTFGTVALLATALTALRSRSQGMVAGLVLLSTPFFILHGTSLYADVPLGFFFLATIVCLALDGRYGAATSRFAVLAGLMAGLAMWTKNEGLLFTLAIVGGLLLAGRSAGWAGSGRRLGAFGVGLLPMLLLTAGFKVGLAPPNDLLSTLGVERTLGNLTDPARYFVTLRAYTEHIGAFGNNGFGSGVWVLTAYILGLGVSRSEVARPWARAGTAAVVLLLAGHFIVFVSMAHELARLLNSSLDRLLLQLWPTALFLFFMVVRTPEEAGLGRQVREPVGHGAEREVYS